MPTKRHSRPIVTLYGTMWARNTENIKRLPRRNEPGGVGIYVLFDGSMPVYVGKGNIHSRVKKARTSTGKKQHWDRFSWYGLSDPELMHDTEMLLLKTLPRNLRALTRQDGKFCRGERKKPDKNKIAEAISRK